MPAALVEARGLVKHFPTRRGQGVTRAVDGVDLVVESGETHGLVGESGCGKSTTGRLVLGLLRPTSGTVRFQGRDIFAASGEEARQLRRRMQLIFQDPYSSLDPRQTVRAIVSEPWLVHGVFTAAERRSRADALLERVGLDPALADRRPRSFSGGQRQRIGIARALALDPALIVCDEPVSALDVSVQGQILNLLADLRRSLGISYLFIAHDLAVVRHISRRVSVMYLGKIVETGTRDDIFNRPAHPYTQALLAAAAATRPDGANRSDAPAVLPGDPPSPSAPPSGCVFRTRCPRAAPRCAQEVPALEDRGQGHPVACHFPG